MFHLAIDGRIPERVSKWPYEFDPFIYNGQRYQRVIYTWRIGKYALRLWVPGLELSIYRLGVVLGHCIFAEHGIVELDKHHLCLQDSPLLCREADMYAPMYLEIGQDPILMHMMLNAKTEEDIEKLLLWIKLFKI